MEPKILLIEDDQEIAEIVQLHLRDHGFEVHHLDRGKPALELLEQETFSLVLLDLMLPDMDGLDICRALRARESYLPVLMLTARSSEADRVLGLELGADDYLPKPFEPRELLARLRAILRRGKGEGHTEIMRFGRLEIDPRAMEARIDGRSCALTTHQFKLLEIMAKAAGRVLSRNYLTDQLRGGNLEAFDRSIDVHISRIRAEVEGDPKHPRRVITVRGAGYVFAQVQD